MGARLWAISDIHMDFRENSQFIYALASDDRYREDTVIVAGDVSHDYELLKSCLKSLTRTFARVYYVPGNHDLWVRGLAPSAMKGNLPNEDSLTRFHRILNLCQELGVKTDTGLIELNHMFVRIVPLFSWYLPNFGKVSRFRSRRDSIGSMDDVYCNWPAALGSPADYFYELSRNRVESLPNDGTPIITFSHFLPRAELMPELDHRMAEALAGFAGDRRIEQLLRAASSALHIFGHSHGLVDQKIDDVRYFQNALGYPAERQNQAPSLALISPDFVDNGLNLLRDPFLSAYPL